jgi:hypothetical protein
LGQLRDLLYEEPSEPAWRALGVLLEAAEGEEERGVLVDYALHHLEGWPDERREVRLEGPWQRAAQRPTLWPLAAQLWVECGLKAEPLVAKLRAWGGWGLGWVVGEAGSVPWGDLLMGLGREAPGVRRLGVRRGVSSGLERGFEAYGLRLEGLSLVLGKMRARDLPSSWPNSLARLDLSENPLGDAGVEALANGGGLSSLRELRLSGIGIGARGCAMLALGPWSVGLERLDLSDNALSDEGALALASGRWGALRRLELRGGRLSPQAWARLEGELGERGVLVQGP